MKNNSKYTFRLITENSCEVVVDKVHIREKLEALRAKKIFFVRLEVSPAINGRKYFETIYDRNKKMFYSCILENRAEGQGFLECRSAGVPVRKFLRLYRRCAFDFWVKRGFTIKPTGIQRNVVFEGRNEGLCMAPYEKKMQICDPMGFYGGYQGEPAGKDPESQEGRMYREIIKKYYPDYDEIRIQRFLEKLQNEGCGYVSIVNAIFDHFTGKEKVFEEKFGFPMYKDDGNFNFYRLLVDFYAKTDNHVEELGIDVIDKNEDRSQQEHNQSYDYTLDNTGYGTTPEARNYRMKLYFKGKGIKVKVIDYFQMNPGLVKKLSQKGYVFMTLHNGNVQNDDRSTYCYVKGHVMLITGMTTDCRYIVSSWGRQLFVDHNEVTGEGNNRTRIHYQYLEFV